MGNKWRLLVLVLGFVLAGCGTNIEDLEGTAWRLVGDADASAVRTIHIDYTGLIGFDGCSPWFSEGDTREAPIQARMRLLTDSVTEICGQAERAAAESFVDDLNTVTEIDLDGERLELRGDDVTLLFEPAPPLDSDRLTDVEWKTRFLAETYNAYDIEDSVSFFRFSSSGTFEAHTGCRPGAGTWDEGVPNFGPLALTGATWEGPLDCSDASVEGDLVFTRLFDSDGQTYIIDNRLYISNADWSLFAVFEHQNA